MASIRILKSGNHQVQIRLKGLKPVYRTFGQEAHAKQFADIVEEKMRLFRALGFSDVDTLRMLLNDEKNLASKELAKHKVYCSKTGI